MPDVTFELDRLTTRIVFKTDSFLIFFSFDEYSFGLFGFKPLVSNIIE